MKKAIRRLKRGSYSIDLLETHRQLKAGTLPDAHRRMIERIMGEVLPTIDPLTGKPKATATERTTRPEPSPTASIQTPNPGGEA